MENSEKNKKGYAPYVILGIIIVVLAALAVFLGARLSISREEETTAPEETTLFMNGLVPYYEDIPASALKAEEFATDGDARMVYSGSVPYSTGIDVSSYQSEIDWSAVAADSVDFAFVRVGFRGYGASGEIFADDYYRQNLTGAANAGIKVGAYFYSQAISVPEAVEEAQFVLDAIEGFDITMPVVFDWETEPGKNMRTDSVSGETLTECAVAFCEEIKKAGYTPCVYFNLHDAYVRYDLSQIKDYVFWFAQYDIPSPEFYYTYSIWQYSATGRVDGISGNVDMNIAFEASA